MIQFENQELLYMNPFAHASDVNGFRMEGEAAISFPLGRMRMENKLDPEQGQQANFVYWCPEDFPSDISVSWKFWPLFEPGLCILFFSARGTKGKDLFDPNLNKRTGDYSQYHHGDINTFHVSYFRRKHKEERAFHTCNLRKSYGFHLVTQGADPIPSVLDATPPYSIRLIKCKSYVAFHINEVPVFIWEDDGQTYGPLLEGGKIGFRQMAPLIGEYADLKVHSVKMV